MTKKDDLDGAFQTNREVLRDIHDKTNRMYNALFGAPEVKQPGLFERVNQLETSSKKQTLIITIISAVSTGIGVAGTALYNFLFVHK